MRRSLGDSGTRLHTRSRPINTPPAQTVNEATSPAISKARPEALKRACLCAKVAEEFRGQDTIVLDLTNVTPIVDYFVISTGSSPRQMNAVAEEVRRVMKEHDSRCFGTEGKDSPTWILQDYGDVVLHVLNTESRKLYDLEHLWADAPRVDWKAATT